MNCNQCGKSIPENSVFCPFCGVPQKVTADYDYIQGEIGANVDKIKTEANISDSEVSHSQRKRRPGSGDDMQTTRDVFGSDTVFNENHSKQDFDQYEDDYYDEYEDDYYEDDYYEDWGIDNGGSNKKTVVTTIIIALICLLGIAAIIFFGLKPQEKNNIIDVIKAYNQNGEEINEGDEYSGEVAVSLVSEQGFDIRYTTDGSDVDENSSLYTAPFTVDEEGTFQFKALSFNENGKPSGDGIAHAIVIIAPTETTTQAPKETEAVFTKEDAEKIIEDALVEEGAIDENGNTEDGGSINLIQAGETKSDGSIFYIIQADYYDVNGAIFETTYYGVNTYSGDMVILEKTDDGYSAIN